MYQCQFISSWSDWKDQWNQEHHRVWCLASSVGACPAVPKAHRKHHRQKRLWAEWQALIKHSKTTPKEKRSEWAASYTYPNRAHQTTSQGFLKTDWWASLSHECGLCWACHPDRARGAGLRDKAGCCYRTRSRLIGYSTKSRIGPRVE